jgi:hypothetical protein
MTPVPLLPSPEAIPAPAWLFHALDVVFFLIHIVLINIILGGSLILLASRFRRRQDVPPTSDVLSHKLPVLFALGINMGVAPLLFMQVIFGHLFYTSSILMGGFWIIVIPLLILAYYAAYIQAKSARIPLVTAGLVVSSLVLLYIGFAFTNNLLLMMQPEKWTGYFVHRGGTLLNTADATFIPRYLHFVTASVAFAGLATASIWTYRKKHGIDGAAEKVATGLKIFGIATLVQIGVGLWFLISLGRDLMLQFMGGDVVATVVFVVGFLSGIGAVATAFGGKYRPTLIQICITLLAMVLTRDSLRGMYLQGTFDTASLQLTPQYGVLALFLIVLLAGLASVVWMLKAGFRSTSGGTAQ